jgi:hypothetical protein
MKTRLFIVLCALSNVTALFCQKSQLYSELELVKAGGVEFASCPAFSESREVIKESPRFIRADDVTYLDFDPASVSKSKNSAIRLDLPVKGQRQTVELFEAPASYTVVTSDGRTFPADKSIKHYRGAIEGYPDSYAAFTFYGDEAMGIFATKEEGNYVITKDEASGKHVLYNDANLKDRPSAEANVLDDRIPSIDPEVLLQPFPDTKGLLRSSAVAPHKVVKLYVETEYDMYTAKSSNLSNLEAYTSGVFNQVSALYQNESVYVNLDTLFMWTTPDPYTGTNGTDLLNDFRNYRDSLLLSLPSDLGMVLTFRQYSQHVFRLDASSFDGLCKEEPYAYSYAAVMIPDSLATIQWYCPTIHYISMALGYLMSSPNTDMCCWNGNNTAIDKYNNTTIPYPCDAALDHCSNTVMSWCLSLLSGTNFANGFGIQPGNRIRNYVNNASCLSTSISWSPAANLDGNGLTGRALLEPYSQDSKIYFDPVSTRLIFNLNIDRAKTPLTVSVYGQTGILLRRFSAGGAAFEADVSDFQPGVCYVLVTDAATNQPVAKQKILVR